MDGSSLQNNITNEIILDKYTKAYTNFQITYTKLIQKYFPDKDYSNNPKYQWEANFDNKDLFIFEN